MLTTIPSKPCLVFPTTSNYFPKRLGFVLQFLSRANICYCLSFYVLLCNTFHKAKIISKNKKQNMKENMGKGKAPIGLRAKKYKSNLSQKL